MRVSTSASRSWRPASLGTRGPMLETLRHLVLSDAFDLFVLTGDRAFDIDDEDLSLAEARVIMERNGLGWAEYISRPLDPDEMVHEVDPTDGYQRWAPVGFRLAGVLNHGTDHRSQVCTALTTLGVEPPRIDVMRLRAGRGPDRGEDARRMTHIARQRRAGALPTPSRRATSGSARSVGRGHLGRSAFDNRSSRDDAGAPCDAPTTSSSVGPSRSPAAAIRSSRLPPGSPLRRIRNAAKTAACGSESPVDTLISVNASSARARSRSSSLCLVVARHHRPSLDQLAHPSSAGPERRVNSCRPGGSSSLVKPLCQRVGRMVIKTGDG